MWTVAVRSFQDKCLKLILNITGSVGNEYQCIFRRYVSRDAATIGRAVLEELGLPPELIRACYGKYPQSEEAVQEGLIKWIERGGDGCTWQALLRAMEHAGIAVHHCRLLKKELSQKIKGMVFCSNSFKHMTVYI